MRKTLLLVVLLAGATFSPAQSMPATNREGGAIEAAITYAPTYAKISNTSCNCFWFQGGAAEVAIPLRAKLAVVGNVTGQHATGITNELNKVDYVAGPRYSFAIPYRHFERMKKSRLFVEALAGAVHATNGIFPEAGSSESSATSYALQLGGGDDLALRSRFGLRLFEADYVRSGLPNNGSNSQNDVRFATGFYYKFGK